MSTTTPIIPTLKQLRVKRGYTVAEIAAACQVATQTIYSWESGYTRVRPPFTRRLCNFYKIEMDYLNKVLDATEQQKI